MAALKTAMPEIMKQREEILRAFIAKYGIDPSECAQIYQADGTNKVTWRVVKVTNRTFSGLKGEK